MKDKTPDNEHHIAMLIRPQPDAELHKKNAIASLSGNDLSLAPSPCPVIGW